MLRFMRENAGSWIIKILLGVVVVVFIFLGLGPDDPKNESAAAVVDGKVITMDEYRAAFNQIMQRYRSQFGDNLTDDMIKMLKIRENTLEGLIEKELLLQTSKKLGIRVTDDELRYVISNTRYFQENGQFSPSLYNNFVRNTYQRPELFEIAQRNDLVVQKFRGLVNNTEPVAEKEIQQWFLREKSEVNVSYVLFDPAAQAGIKPSEEEVKAHYEKNKDLYKSEPTARVSLVAFKPDDFAGKVSVTDQDIEAAYMNNRSQYETPKTVEARHILIKVDQGADQAQVEKARTRVQDIYRMAVGESKDFAELAKTYSEDSTRDKGGYLGAFEQNAMVKPFADKAFSMKAGEISEPVRTQFGWHLIKVEKINEAKSRQMADVKDEIRKKLIREKAAGLAYEAADAVYNLMVGGSDLAQAAKSVDLTTTETGFFTQAQGPAELDPAVARDFSQIAFALSDKATSEILEFNGTYYIARMLEKKPAAVRPVEEVRDKVYADVLNVMKDEQAKKSAEALILAIKEGRADMDTTRNVKESGFFTRNATADTQPLDPEVMKAAFELSTAKNMPDAPIKGGKGYYVIRLKEKKEPDSTLFEQEKDRIRSELTEKKRAHAFRQWLDQLKSKSTIERVLNFNE